MVSHREGILGILGGLAVLVGLAFGLARYPDVTLLCVGCFALGGYVARSVSPRR